MYNKFALTLWAKPQVATMKSKSLLALALTAAVGGPAWSQNSGNDSRVTGNAGAHASEGGTGPSDLGHTANDPSASGGIGSLIDYSALYKFGFGWATGESPAPRTSSAPSAPPPRQDRFPNDHGKGKGGNGDLNPRSRESLERPASQNPFETINPDNTSRDNSSSYDPYDPYLTRPAPGDLSSSYDPYNPHPASRDESGSPAPYDVHHAYGDTPGRYDPYNLYPSSAESGGNPNDVSADTNHYLQSLAPPVDGSVAGSDGKDPTTLRGPKDGFDRGSGEKLYDSLFLPTSGQYNDASSTNAVASTPYGADKKRTQLDGDPSGILGFNPYDPKSVLAATPHSGKLTGSGAKSSSLELSELTVAPELPQLLALDRGSISRVSHPRQARVLSVAHPGATLGFAMPIDKSRDSSDTTSSTMTGRRTSPRIAVTPRPG